MIAATHRLTLFRAGLRATLVLLERIDASKSVVVHFPPAEAHAAPRGGWLARLAPRPVTYTDAVSFAVMQMTGRRHVLGFDQDFPAVGFPPWWGLG